MATLHSARFYGFIGWLGNTRVVTRLHPLAYRVLGGRGVTGSTLGVRHVILTTTGRHTGRPRDVPLFAFRDGDRIVVVASKNGSDDQPAWVLNLRADPRGRVRIGRETRAVLGYEAEGDERARLWAIAVAGYAGYELYQRQTPRRIPVVVLEPAAAREAA